MLLTREVFDFLEELSGKTFESKEGLKATKLLNALECNIGSEIDNGKVEDCVTKLTKRVTSETSLKQWDYVRSYFHDVLQQFDNEELVVCRDCGKIIKDFEAYEDGEEYICRECLEENYNYCDECGGIFKNEELTDVNGNLVCENCLDDYYICCEDCGNYVRTDDAYFITNPDGEDYYVCESCYYDYYSYCEDCGRYFHIDDLYEYDGLYYCDECRDDNGYGDILEYHGYDDWFDNYVDNRNESTLKGFELEVENTNGADNIDTVGYIKGLFNDMFVFEHDGSLSDDGIEIISNPFTMPWLYDKQDKIKSMLEHLSHEGYTSHNNYRCGLHIHVNKGQLDYNTKLSSDEVITNIIVILEMFKSELIAFSRRTSSQISEWCSFYTDEGETLTFRKIKYKKNNGDRYKVLNLGNYSTIEFRIFRGTLKFESLMASIELVDNIVEIAKQNRLDNLTWDKIISYSGDYCKQYSDSRGIESDTVIELESLSDDDSNILKAGMRVRVKNDLNGSGHGNYSGEFFGVNSEMNKYCGRYVTIKSLLNEGDAYTIKEDNRSHSWNNDMFDMKTAYDPNDTNRALRVGDRVKLLRNGEYVMIDEVFTNGFVTSYKCKGLMYINYCFDMTSIVPFGEPLPNEPKQIAYNGDYVVVKIDCFKRKYVKVTKCWYDMTLGWVYEVVNNDGVSQRVAQEYIDESRINKLHVGDKIEFLGNSDLHDTIIKAIEGGNYRLQEHDYWWVVSEFNMFNTITVEERIKNGETIDLEKKYMDISNYVNGYTFV